MRANPNPTKETQRRQLARDRAKYLAAGHRIETLPIIERAPHKFTRFEIDETWRNPSKGKFVLTKTQTIDMVQAYKNGESMKKLAARFGCHATTIGSALRREGIPIRTAQEETRALRQELKARDWKLSHKTQP